MAKKAKQQRSGVAVIADVHAANHKRWGGSSEEGLNHRARLVVTAVNEAVTVADNAGCSHLVVAGDLFDSWRPEPAVVTALQHEFNSARERGVEVVVLPGNHDLIDADAAGGNTACAPLWQSAQLVIEPGWWRLGDLAVLMVPFQAHVPMALHLGEVLSGHKVPAEFAPGAKRLLVTHVGVYGAEDATPWQKRAKDAVEAKFLLNLMEDAGIETAFVGNYHDHHRWVSVAQRRIFQVGTLAPASFSDAGLKDRGLVAVYKDGGIKMVEAFGPRFVDVPGHLAAHELERMGAASLRATFVRVADGTELGIDPGRLGGVEFADEPEAASVAGDPIASPPADPGAELAAFVEEMELPEDVDRRAVAALVAECWKKGA